MRRLEAMQILEVLGISVNARDTQVLGAILQLQMTNHKSHTVDEIHKKVIEIIQKKFSKAWIYKCLSNLEEADFVTVNRIDTPNTYSVDQENLGKALEISLEKKIIELQKAEAVLQNRIDLLESSASDEIALHILESLTGEKEERTTGVIEGLQNVRSAIVRELCTNVGEGDILRINDRANLLDLNEISSGHVESRIVESAKKGLEVHVLFKVLPFSDATDDSAIDSFLKGEGAILEDVLMNGKIQARVVGEQEVGYRMLSLNQEKMLLFLADAPKPDTVALITQEANEVLINNAVDAFKAAWECATDITKRYAARFAKIRKQK